MLKPTRSADLRSLSFGDRQLVRCLQFATACEPRQARRSFELTSLRERPGSVSPQDDSLPANKKESTLKVLSRNKTRATQRRMSETARQFREQGSGSFRGLAEPDLSRSAGRSADGTAMESLPNVFFATAAYSKMQGTIRAFRNETNTDGALPSNTYLVGAICCEEASREERDRAYFART